VFAGVDFPVLLYDLMVKGRVVPTFDYRTGVYARYTPREIYWLRANLGTPAERSDLIKRGLGPTFGEMRNLLTLRETWDVESIRDPMPGLYAWVETLGQLGSSLSSRLRTRRARRFVESVGRVIRKDEGWLAERLKSVRSVLVLCRGNINRSPVAATRLRDVLIDHPAPPRVRSGGFIPREGRTSSRLSSSVATGLGVDLKEHRSACVHDAWVNEADLIVVMDAQNAEELLAGWPAAKDRVIPLGALDSKGSVEISDPYGGTEEEMRDTYTRIVRCIDHLASLWTAAS